MAKTTYKAWQANACTTIRGGLEALVQTTYETFLEYAAKAESKALQTLFFSAYGEIKRGGSRLIGDFMLELEQISTPAGFDRPSEFTAEDESLSLMSNDSFERALALETVADRVWQAHYETYFGLQHRLGQLIRGQTLENQEIPAGPVQLAEIFDKCTNAINIEQQARLALYTLFEDFLYNQVAPLHRELDEKLKDAGILPELKIHHIKVNASQPRIPDIQGLKQELFKGHQTDTSVGDAVLTRIRGLLGTQRGGHAPAQYGTPASIETIEDAVQQAGGAIETRLPHHDLFDSNTASPVFPGALRATRIALRQQRQAIKEIIGPDKLGAFNEDTIEIVGGIFEVMLEEEQLPNAAKALLSHLHTPYLRLSIREPDLLSDEQHPARKLLDRFVSAAIEWVDDRDLEKGLFPWLRESVNALIHAPTLDHTQFTAAEATLDKRVAELEQQQARRQDRAVEKERGRSMLEHAYNIVQMELQRLQENSGGARCADFLDNTWHSYLTLVLLRNQCDVHCGDWQSAQHLGQHICQAASLHAAGESPGEDELEKLEQLLTMQVASLLPENKRWIRQLMDKLQAPAKAPINEEASTTKEFQTPQPLQTLLTSDDERNHEALSDEERQMADQLTSLPAGTLIYFKPSQDTLGRMLKLAWYNHITRHFLLVDISGTKQERMALCDLARGVIGNLAVIQDTQRPSFFKRALMALQSLLEKTG